MGLKQDLIDAKVKAAKDNGIPVLDTKPGSFIEREAHYTAEAIAKFITEADFTITQLKAPVVVEEFSIPTQKCNIELETLLGDKKPILKTLKQIGSKIPGADDVITQLVDQLEGAISKAVKPLLKGGANLPSLNVGKTSGGLQSSGYVFVGSDPDSQGSFDVSDEDGQRSFTTVKLLRKSIEKLL